MSKKKNTPVLIIGESGEGKSTSFQHLPPKRTIVLNTENKDLPFKDSDKFVNKIMDSFKRLDATLDVLATDAGKDKYDYAILDSFTSATEIINRYAEFAFAGYDQWKNYNSMIVEIIIKLKKLPQQVFVVAIPEQKDIGFNQTKSYARVKGKELKYGHLEKEFAIVLYTNPSYDDESGEMTDVEFIYKPNKNNTAKAPVGLFSERPKNDALFVAEAIKAFYGRKEEQTS